MKVASICGKAFRLCVFYNCIQYKQPFIPAFFFKKWSCLGWIFCVFFPCLGMVQTQLESLIGHAMAEPSHTQWNISFIKAGLLFMFTVVWWVFKKWGPYKPFPVRNNKRLVGTRFALLPFKAFDKGILGNAVFQNPVLTS